MNSYYKANDIDLAGAIGSMPGLSSGCSGFNPPIHHTFLNEVFPPHITTTILKYHI